MSAVTDYKQDRSGTYLVNVIKQAVIKHGQIACSGKSAPCVGVMSAFYRVEPQSLRGGLFNSVGNGIKRFFGE